MSLDGTLAFISAYVAVMMDLKSETVSNRWILFSLGAGWICQVTLYGTEGIGRFFLGAIPPIILLFPLFLLRMLGPGDVKLFAALGGMLGFHAVCCCILQAFFLGAVLSLAILIDCGIFCQRIHYFINYIDCFWHTRRRTPYYQPGCRLENIHFTVPILMSVLVYMGGID